MEKFSQFQNSNIETGWENSVETERSKILAEISNLETRRASLEARMREELQYMREANQDEMDVSDIYHSMSGIFEDKMWFYDNQFYEIDVKIDGLKFQLSKLESNN